MVILETDCTLKAIGNKVYLYCAGLHTDNGGHHDCPVKSLFDVTPPPPRANTLDGPHLQGAAILQAA
jgi:hypothetical protein